MQLFNLVKRKVALLITVTVDCFHTRSVAKRREAVATVKGGSEFVEYHKYVYLYLSHHVEDNSVLECC